MIWGVQGQGFSHTLFIHNNIMFFLRNSQVMKIVNFSRFQINCIVYWPTFGHSFLGNYIVNKLLVEFVTTFQEFYTICVNKTFKARGLTRFPTDFDVLRFGFTLFVDNIITVIYNTEASRARECMGTHQGMVCASQGPKKPMSALKAHISLICPVARFSKAPKPFRPFLGVLIPSVS